jgi:citrate synthase
VQAFRPLAAARYPAARHQRQRISRSNCRTTRSLGAPVTTKNTLSITDNRTGKTYEVPITDGTIKAMDLRAIKVDDKDFGMMTYDPAFMNTAACRSAITYIDGDKGILRYRGYPIEQLAEDSTFLEVAWLLRHGELPDQSEYDQFVHDITYHTYVHENMRKFLEGFRYDAHPMAMLNSSVAALASFYPSSRNIFEESERNISIIRLLAKMPTIAAFCYRHSKGLPFVYPDNDLSYVENFLSMVARMSEPKYEANPIFVRALEVLFILHADHEQNCSTSAVRAVGSSHVDPFSAMSAGIAALFGPLHGGANEQVLRMIAEIGTVKNVPSFIEQVKAGKGKLMGFGHRVYKSYDPRAKIVKKLADEVFEVVGVDKDLEIALELERIALSDEYFISRKLYPNVDFYTGLIYRSMAFPTEFFTVLFAIARTAGWMSQWEEMLLDKEQKIARPRQIYTGPGERPYKPRIEHRHTVGPRTQKDALRQ